MLRLILPLIISVITYTALIGQAPKRWDSGDIYEAIQKLNFLGSALYVAAHPDDENTRLIAYLANEKKAETAYLSMTRGDGGQNLIGPEIAELLGLIRTQELLAARRTDGGNQFFTRANDFGFSKHPDETLNVWNKEEILADVVWAIRKWQPDVVINRFWHEYEERLAGRMHGHHTASGQLSFEAFELAARRDVFPEQLQYVAPWQPRRLYFNSYTWFRDSREIDSTRLGTLDVGVYYPIKGLSNNEIAARSRSMHKCQGFGVPLSRGSETEELLLLKGDKPEDPADLFAGINTTWTRVPGGAPIGKILADVEREFRFDDPAAGVPKLVEAYRLIKALPDGHWKRVKLPEIKEVIRACLALYAEAAAADFSATPGEAVQLSVEFTNRSPVEVALLSIDILPTGEDTTINQVLENNQPLEFKKTVRLPADMAYTTPYWLSEPWKVGRYTVVDQQLRGLPETPRSFRMRYFLRIAGEPIEYTTDVVYKSTDPVKGEFYRPFEVVPPVFTSIADKAYIFTNESPQTVTVVVKAGRDDVSGSVRLADYPDDWRIEPASIDFSIDRKGASHTVTFKVFPPARQGEGEIHAVVDLDGQTYHQEMMLIDYDHIPTQTVLRDAKAKVVKIDLKKDGERVAYIMGAGDEIPASLGQIGYQVDILEEGDVTAANLKKYDALILGIRAYNTVEWLKFKQPLLFDYVRDGGTMIVQYNTNRRLVLDDSLLAPYPLELSRDRVTVEEAEMRFLKPDHQVLNFPNKITSKDFEGWIQERGLYFPGKWDENHFDAVFSSNDPGEEPMKGSLLVAKYGDGYYVYTGLSFFRELPAGVSGAYRLFANMISLGQEPKP